MKNSIPFMKKEINMITVPDPKDLVEKIKKAREKQELSLNDMNTIMKKKYNYSLGTTTISRLLSGDYEADSFNYLHTLIPLYNAIVVDDESDADEKIEDMQAMLDYKLECIESLENELKREREKYKNDIEKIKSDYHKKLDKETKNFQEIMEFRSHQIELKDELISQIVKDNSKLTDHIVNCPLKGKCE